MLLLRNAPGDRSDEARRLLAEAESLYKAMGMREFLNRTKGERP